VLVAPVRSPGRTVVPNRRLACDKLRAAAVIAFAEDGSPVVFLREGHGDGTWRALGWMAPRA
jgi:hypothetical protein